VKSDLLIVMDCGNSVLSLISDGSIYTIKGREGKRKEKETERKTKVKEVGVHLYYYHRKQNINGLQKHQPIVFTQSEVIKDDCQSFPQPCENDISNVFPFSKRAAISVIHPSVAFLILSLYRISTMTMLFKIISLHP